MNTVSVIARVVGEPRLRRTRAGIPECRMRLAVPRYSGGGTREPGVVYVEASTFGLRARECAERLSEGSTVGLSGRLDSDPRSGQLDRDPREQGVGILIDQLDLL